jgi:hypothetical protein
MPSAPRVPRLWVSRDQVHRIVLLTAVLVLALAPSADAQLARSLAPDGTELSLEDGRGSAIVLSRDGVMYGQVARGRIVVTDYPRGAETDVDLRGCDRRQRLSRLTVVCAGRGLRFQIADGRWRAAIRGTGIDAAAIVTGAVTLEGTRGTYSIGEDEAAEEWPREPRTFALA